MHQFTLPKSAIRPVSIWLMVVILFLIGMILVGGLTRLTDSGLSITEWKPISGVLPPLGLADWQSEFQKYRQIPEFRLQNSAMTLSEFQSIYWWEWGHRLLGRTIGLVVALPLLFFWIKGFLSKHLKRRLSLLFVLGGFQGFMGWWMVSSGLGGLGDVLDVSPYRLVIHLGLALVILGLSVWTYLDVSQSNKRSGWQVGAPVSNLAWFVLALVYVQMLLGGFVAGNDGGMIANTWPLIEGGLAPHSYGDMSPFWRNWFENPVITQFHHRIGAYLALSAGLVLAWKMYRETLPAVRKIGLLVGVILCSQVLLGIWTLVAVTPLPLAVSHQFLALVTFLVVLNATHASSRTYRVS